MAPRTRAARREILLPSYGFLDTDFRSILTVRALQLDRLHAKPAIDSFKLKAHADFSLFAAHQNGRRSRLY
jgi:hypothetical protein